VVICACALIGLQVLDFFNISLQSFQVGGGLLLLISAMNMLNARPAEDRPTPARWKPEPKKRPWATALRWSH
jgi:multiple antibiotic resistance protein